jgi:hypothetical protein
MSWEVRLPEEATIRFEVQNSKPVDLFDLTSALSAFGEAYQDHIIQSGIDLDRDHGTDTGCNLFLQAEGLGSCVIRCDRWEQTQPGFRYSLGDR